MFREIFSFELRYRLRRPAVYVYFVLYLLIGLLYGAILSGALGPESAGQLSGGGKNHYNSPWVIHQILLVTSQLAIFAVAGIMAVPVYRDFQYQAHELFFTKPITKLGYLGGRFLGSLLMTLPVLFSLALGLMLAFAIWLPDAGPEKAGPFVLWHYVLPYLVHVIPFTLFSGAVYFATVSLSRQQIFIYLNAIVVIVLLSVAGAITSQLENKTLASLLDPTGAAAFQTYTEYWTVAERNSLTFPLNLVTLGNQLIWLSIGAGIFLFTYRRFQFHYALDGGAPPKAAGSAVLGDTLTIQKVEIPRSRQRFGLGPELGLLARLAREEMRVVLRGPIFWVILGIAVLFVGILVAFSGQIFGTSTYPVTYQMLDILTGNFLIFILAIIVFYAGEMVWRERDADMGQIYDALPIPNWLSYASKFLAMAGLLGIVSLLILVCGLVIQAVQGYFRFEIGLYLQELFFFQMLNLLMFAVLAFLVQTLAGNKYLGFFLTVLVFLFFRTALPLMGIEDRLLLFLSSTPLVYSDMNGFGHYVGPHLLFRLYWGGLCLVLAALTGALWVRGSEDSLRSRWKALRARMSRPAWATVAAGLLIFLATGSYIYYNTHILNEFVTSREAQRLQSEYEKRYRIYEGIPQPKILSVSLEVDLHPQERSFDARGRYWLYNPHDQPLDSLHLFWMADMEEIRFSFDRPAEQLLHDPDFGYSIYRLEQPLAPGDSLLLRFEERFRIQGFPNGAPNVQVVENGSFINNYYFPSIGYDRNFELSDADLRKKYGLPERERFPAITDSAYYGQHLISADADWIDFEATVSTDPDQVAITPGYLQREWEENGRRYFHYRMDSRMAKFYSIVSARYGVRRDTWQAPDGREIRLEIYHHPAHTYNLDGMMAAMKQSLAYYSTAFGPYPHRQARILEFPRYQGFAQSFANTIPYSEAVGFIAKVKEGDVDYPFYITAHELAHQWWPHQVLPANVQGFQFLSETLSQYSALMVMEKRFGEQEMKKYLRYELDNYLQGRTAEQRKELPALYSENQAYIHYNKGSLLMYALKDYIGEDSLNRAMARYLSERKFAGAPYATTLDWMRYVEAATPDSLRGVADDLFRRITLYDIKTDSVRARKLEADSLWELRVYASISKLYDDGSGAESEAPLDDYVDLGVYGRKKVGGAWRDTALYFQRRHITQDSLVFTLRVGAEPREAGLDPLHKLIDRKPDDNRVRVKLEK